MRDNDDIIDPVSLKELDELVKEFPDWKDQHPDIYKSIFQHHQQQQNQYAWMAIITSVECSKLSNSPSDPDTMTNTAAEAISSSTGRNQSNNS